MNPQIYLQPGLSSAGVIRIGDACYQLAGPSNHSPDTFAIDVGFDDCSTCEESCVTPDIYSDTVSYFNGGADYPPGTYVVSYATGAMDYGSDGDEWSINGSYRYGNGFYVVAPNDGIDQRGPWDNTSGDYSYSSNPTEAEGVAAGTTYTLTLTVPGPIGMYLHDSPYSDNLGNSPDPTFCVRKTG